MNQIQSIRPLSAGLTNFSVDHTSADQNSGDVRLPQKAARRDGNIGSNTAKSTPTRTEIKAWLIKATTKPAPLKAASCATSASAREGIATAASRLIGYQILRYAIKP